MGTDHKGNVRGFHHLSRAWYADANLAHANYVDEVTFGFYCPDGGTSGEMCVRFERLGGSVAPCLRVWNDAWDTLHRFSDVIAEMAKVDDERISPEEFCAILLKCGFVDMTAVVQGHDWRKEQGSQP